MSSTPTEDEATSDPRSYATLRLFGPTLDPAEVTTLIGVRPTTSHRMGDRASAQAVPSRHGLWALSSSGLVDSADLDAHVRYVLERVEPAAAAIRDLLQNPDWFGDVFCYLLRDRDDGGPTISVGNHRLLSDLGLQLGLDIYGPYESDSGRPGREIRERQREIINASLRRPGMYGGQLVLMHALQDLAWSHRRERDLARFGENLVERSMWTSTGFVGAFERLIPAIDANAAAASVFADAARDFGWLVDDRGLDGGSYWRIVNGASALLREDVDLDGVVAALGQPTITIGGSRGGAVGFAGPERNQPFVWFHAADANRNVLCSRRGGSEPFVDSVVFTPLGESLRDPNPYPSELLRRVPPPFRLTTMGGRDREGQSRALS